MLNSFAELLRFTYKLEKFEVDPKTPWKNTQLKETVDVPFSYIDNSGVQARSSSYNQVSLDTDAMMYTLSDFDYKRDDIILDTWNNIQYTIRGHERHPIPGTTEYNHTRLFLEFAGYIK